MPAEFHNNTFNHNTSFSFGFTAVIQTIKQTWCTQMNNAISNVRANNCKRVLRKDQCSSITSWIGFLMMTAFSASLI